ncbi:hypothetical protein [Nitrospira lenta]|uniref:Uncharacterized protein n=1 Tax=Nitrospira lenta TaxID=1436998 RepID=A0A330LDU4_9BACT|nr:hypothetical protein [Nitrospira lenta]SPP65110.1 hypothetical protein NITLEN_30024 [Nitrospira lenta]
MSAYALLDAPALTQVGDEALESIILGHLDEQAVISLDALVILLPDYSWNQIFHVVDRLARCGGITLRRHRSEYTLFSTHYAA